MITSIVLYRLIIDWPEMLAREEKENEEPLMSIPSYGGRYARRMGYGWGNIMCLCVTQIWKFQL